MTARRWSLAGRLTRLLAVTTTGIVVTVFGVSAWLLHQSVERELSSLLVEEFAEFDAVFSPGPQDPEEFARVADVLDRLHPANPLGWRAWKPDGVVFAEHDPHALLGRVPMRPSGLDEHVAGTHAAGHLRWRVDMLSNGMKIATVVDGSAQLGVIERIGSIGIGLALLATLVVVGIGSALCLRSARRLRRMAETIRSLPAVEAWQSFDVEGAPEEIRAVANALSQMLQNLRRDRDQARLMTAGLAHELRSPLQNLLGEAEVALLRDRTPDDYRALLVSQLEELDDLRRVVDNLVALSSPSDPPGTEREEFDLGREVELRSQRERKVAQRQGVELQLEAQGDVTISGDREVLLLAVSNLISNAIRFTPAGGSVRVTCSGDSEKIAMTVDDSGPGIAPNERERIFETFFQGRSPDESRIGYGLGLALARRAVEIHHGRITVGDAPQGGARFRIELPRHVGLPDGVAADAIFSS